jgi:hypothetical protein
MGAMVRAKGGERRHLRETADMKSPKERGPRPRGRPRKTVKRPRGRPKSQVKKKVGRPPWNLKTDPDRFAIVATIILNQAFKFSERRAAEIALDRFEPLSQSQETLRWKARKTRAMLRAERKAERDGDQRIKSNMWRTVRWYWHMVSAIFFTIRMVKVSQQYQRVEQIRIWAALAEEVDYAEAKLVPLALSGFGYEPPKAKISQ